MSFEELNEWTVSVAEPAFRTKQIFQWMHQKCVSDPQKMTNLPQALRDKMVNITSLDAIDIQRSADGTCKYLFALSDGALIESVLMRYSYGNTVCISSQVGCRMGCRFCASTLGGLERNLSPAEMLDQIYKISLDINERISRVVVMGTGEPFDNYVNLIRFIDLITDERGYNLSVRNITVSTCGIIERIKDFADLKKGVTLAISLHAPNDELRRTIMPIAEKYSVSEIADAAGYYFEKTGRRITFEYALSEGLNDTDECIDELARLCRRIGAHVNLIPVNPVSERGYLPTGAKRVAVFKNKLEKQGRNFTIRRELGRDIDGACGQLRKRHMGEIK